MDDVIQSKVMGRMVSSAEYIQHEALESSPGAVHSVNKVKIANKGL